MTKSATFAFFLVAWAIASGNYLLVRFYGTLEIEDFAQNRLGVLGAWIVSSSILASAAYVADRITSQPAIRAKPYGFVILVHGTILVVAILFTLFMGRVLALAIGTVQPAELIPVFLDHLTHRTTFASIIYVTVANCVIMFVKQMIDRSGVKVICNLVLGKYQFPREESRVFLFLDMRSSTTIAEKLGHIRYSQLIQECFRDLTDCAIRHEVEIYQYVGDEAVLTWEIEPGLRECNCLHVFFDFSESIRDRAEYYQEKFGLVPQFKAGVNAGPVMVAEVGVVKREIAYHSDVLNTAARIQGKCNELGYDLLVSEATRDLLPCDSSLNFTSVGHLELRGKEETVEIVGVTNV